VPRDVTKFMKNRPITISAISSFDSDATSAPVKRKIEKERVRGEEERKNARMPACQQVDKGLKRVHVSAQIFASPHLARRRGASFLDSCLS